MNAGSIVGRVGGDEAVEQADDLSVAGFVVFLEAAGIDLYIGTAALGELVADASLALALREVANSPQRLF